MLGLKFSQMELRKKMELSSDKKTARFTNSGNTPRLHAPETDSGEQPLSLEIILIYENEN